MMDDRISKLVLSILVVSSFFGVGWAESASSSSSESSSQSKTKEKLAVDQTYQYEEDPFVPYFGPWIDSPFYYGYPGSWGYNQYYNSYYYEQPHWHNQRHDWKQGENLQQRRNAGGDHHQTQGQRGGGHSGSGGHR